MKSPREFDFQIQKTDGDSVFGKEDPLKNGQVSINRLARSVK